MEFDCLSLTLCAGGDDERGGSEQGRAPHPAEHPGRGAGGPGRGGPCSQGKWLPAPQNGRDMKPHIDRLSQTKRAPSR